MRIWGLDLEFKKIVLWFGEVLDYFDAASPDAFEIGFLV